MTPEDLYADIPVMKVEKFSTIRQLISPPDQISIPRLLEALHAVLRKGKFTGHFTVTLNQGGVRNIVTEQRIEE